MKKETIPGARVALYARVSTGNGQDTDLQLRDLRAYCKRHGWKITAEYVDQGVSGTRKSRPQLDRLMRAAERHDFDIVAVWKFDRFARSIIHLAESLKEFQRFGVDFVSMTEQIDTTGHTGKLVFHILGAVAEWEREQIVERIRAGIRNKRAKGWWPGPKGARHITPRIFREVHHLREKKAWTLRRIGEKFNLPAMTVWKLCRRDAL